MITIPDGMKRPAESRRDELERENADLKKLVEQMSEALKELSESAVVLSRDYLSAFDSLKNNETIQGWPKSRWLKAIAAYDKAMAALEAAKGGK
jgi:microsomal dipeptidase-like Zn-dependent dipeptidase